MIENPVFPPSYHPLRLTIFHKKRLGEDPGLVFPRITTFSSSPDEELDRVLWSYSSFDMHLTTAVFFSVSLYL